MSGFCEKADPTRILILRSGSLGDTVVALPAFQMIAEAFPCDERIVLTALPKGNRAVQLEAVLDGTGYVDAFRSYDATAPLAEKVRQVRAIVREVEPRLTIYLKEARGGLLTFRDFAFFWIFCGVLVRALPITGDLARCRFLAAEGRFEEEGERLQRVLQTTMGLRRCDDLDRIRLSLDERSRGEHLLTAWPGKDHFIAAALGCRLRLKDWGEQSWTEVLARIGHVYPRLGLVFLGTEEDREQAVRVARIWRGPVLNLCGAATPRVSAAVLERASLFLGNDGGTMHLAAAVGTPCVVVFTARSPRGVWFPHGSQHRVHYHDVTCSGCLLDECLERQRECITSISVDEVYQSALALTGTSRPRMSKGS